ncbi:MAG: glucosamine-6-phosphate deaminase [Erysipelothrix sp.]|nr:glucosamine-6-phosphate deaminase [Erysipelothrix sp.]
MKIIKVKDYAELSETAAKIMSDAVKNNPKITLGLATGGSPVQLYANLVADHKNNGTSYKDVTTYNLDEYIGLDQNHEQSYYTFMRTNLFDHIDIDFNNVHLPKGDTDDHQAEADRYEAMLESTTVDLQLLGIGTNGHIGFNEPGSSFEGVTAVVDLTPETIESNARYFEGNEDLVPTEAISMGIASIMRAKEILLIASGANKQKAVLALVEGDISEDLPASALRNHPNVTLVIDDAAAALLK